MNTPLGVLRFFLPAISLLFLVTALFTARRFSGLVWQLVEEMVIGGLGFLLLYLFFRYKNDFKSRFGPLAYSTAVSRFAFPGVVIIAAAIAHMRYIPGPVISRAWWSILLPPLGWTLIAVGVLLFLRALQTFGVDNLIMLYVYFPEESRFVNHRIYHLLRHPAYAAAQCIAFGLALLNGNWLALACALIFSLGLWGWVRLVEEKELIDRFGPTYVEYRRRVPAFWPHLRDLRGLFGFLMVGR